MITNAIILTTVSNALGASRDGILGKSQKADVTLARQFCMFYSAKYDLGSYAEIGEYFGGRDHSTVSSSIKTIKNWLETDKSKKELHDRMISAIRRTANKQAQKAREIKEKEDKTEILCYPDYINN
jgi:chromosomal replication initiator protein